MSNKIMKRFEKACKGNPIGAKEFPNSAEIIRGFLGKDAKKVEFHVLNGSLDIGDGGSPYRLDTVSFPSMGFSVVLLLSFCVEWEWTVQDVTDIDDTSPTEYLTACSFASLLAKAIPDACIRLLSGGEAFSLSPDRVEESGDGRVITIHA